MRRIGLVNGKLLGNGSSAIAVAFTLMHAGSGMAQSSSGQVIATAAAQATSVEKDDERDIVVTGSRIDRFGFDQPTPTTVIGEAEIRMSMPANLQQLLHELPQVKTSGNTSQQVGSQGVGTTAVDLRGLGAGRTLGLINGRPSIAEGQLNFIPQSLVERVEVVTGGASAAYGSGAVSGVYNLILDTDFEGIAFGGTNGVSSRTDGHRYSVDGSYGTRFADGKGHVMVGGEYVKDKGIDRFGRQRRSYMGAGTLVVDAAGTRKRFRDVNSNTAYYGGLVRSGIFAGQVFNPDGTLRPYRGPTILFGSGTSGVGGEDASQQNDDLHLIPPNERFDAYGRVSFDIGDATVWADLNYGRSHSEFDMFPDAALAAVPLTVKATNPFLSPLIRSQLAAAGQTSFQFGRVYRDIFFMRMDTLRKRYEGAIGVDGKIGNKWKYSAYYNHGDLRQTQEFHNARLRDNFNRAVDAVLSNGQIVCAVNADPNPANDDPACRPLNIFGEGNASPEAIDYVTATQGASSVATLDAVGVEVQGDLGSLWAGPISIAFGAEAQWNESSGRLNELTQKGVFGVPIFGTPIPGSTNVKEAFAEAIVPLWNADDFKVDFQGAVRYSEFSRAGSFWSWKAGGTARVFNDLLLRTTRSRDMRAPNITELFGSRSLSFGTVTDFDTAGRLNVIPGYDPAPRNVETFQGGNPNLRPEVGNTLTVGGSFSPSFIPGLSLSADYFDIEIEGAISSLGGSTLTQACAAGFQPACDRVIRDPVTQTIRTVFTDLQNLAVFKTSGFDLEAAYVIPVAKILRNGSGRLRFRGLATYVDKFVSNNGVTRVDGAGFIGEGATNAVPHWRGLFSASYQDDVVALDARVRYIGGGKFSQNTLTAPVPNHVDARTYVDVGAQVSVQDNFTFNLHVRNLFDTEPPIANQSSLYHDVVGRYFTVGARVEF